MSDKRVIELVNERLTLTDGDMVLLDSSAGTFKYNLYNINQLIANAALTFTDDGDGNITVSIQGG